MGLYALLGPLIRLLPPESAHGLALWALEHRIVPIPKQASYRRLQQRVWGMEFSHPLGLAAGFDKNATAVNALFEQGLAFVEVGTITPQPQPGNQKPRIFRLPEDGAIINRLGFNSEGSAEILPRVRDAYNQENRGVIGVNIGKNKETVHAEIDYSMLLGQYYGVADYITVNISSPNTEGLRNLQQKEYFDMLLRTVMKEKEHQQEKYERDVPVLVKIAPDLSMGELQDIADLALEHELDGLIVSNTTIARPENLQHRAAAEKGGLSGVPLMEPSTRVLSDMYRMTFGEIPIIGVGGIASGADAYRKIRAGASLLQAYSAFVYQGFELVEKIKYELDALLGRDGFAHIEDAIGADHPDIERSKDAA